MILRHSAHVFGGTVTCNRRDKVVINAFFVWIWGKKWCNNRNTAKTGKDLRKRGHNNCAARTSLSLAKQWKMCASVASDSKSYIPSPFLLCSAKENTLEFLRYWWPWRSCYSHQCIMDDIEAIFCRITDGEIDF